MKKIINNKGITLVALVITIIILIILAGITLSLVFREDGLINKAKTGGESYKEESARESIHLAYIGASTNSELKLNENEFRKSLNEQLGEGNYTYSINDETGEITVVYNGKEYKISSNGTMEESEAEEEEEEYTGPLYTIVGEVVTTSGSGNDASVKVIIYDENIEENNVYSNVISNPKDYGEFSLEYTNMWHLTINDGYEIYYSTANDGTGIEKLSSISWSYNEGKHYYLIKAHNFSIKFDLAGGKKCANMTYTKYSPTFTLPKPMKDGYFFKGWIESRGDTPNRELEIEKGTEGNKKYTAVWEESDFDVIGEVITVSGSPYDSRIKTIMYDDDIEEIVSTTDIEGSPKNYGSFTVRYESQCWHIVTNEGYELYYSTSNLGDNIETLTDISWSYNTGKHYYIIKGKKYTITYNLEGGSRCENRTYTKYTPTFTLLNPVKDSNRFVGWTGSNGNVPQTEVTIEKGTTGNKTYTANWTPSDYTVIGEIITTSGGGNDASVKVIYYPTNTEENKVYYSSGTATDYTYFKLYYGNCWVIESNNPYEMYYTSTLTDESTYTKFTTYGWGYNQGVHYYILVKN